MFAKEIFLKDKQLASWWNGIIQDDRFSQVCTFARAQMMQDHPAQDRLIGGDDMLTILETLPESQATGSPFPDSGIHHDFKPSNKLNN